MKKIKWNIIVKYLLTGLIGVLIFTSSLWAQIEETYPGERIILHTDRDVYIAGESIWFKAYYLWEGSSEQRLSNVLYIELFNANEKSLAKSKFSIENGVAAGTIIIPDETPTGSYFFRAYTRFQRNFASEYYFTTRLFVIHPDFPVKNVISDQDETSSPPGYKINKRTDDILINTSKEEYHPRELIEIELTVFDKQNSLNPNVSVSVVKRGTFLDMDKILPETVQPEIKSSDIKNLEFLPEIRDVSISGILRDAKSKEPVSGHRVYASVLFGEPQIHVYKTHDDGRFVFSLNDLSGVQDLFLSFMPRENKKLEMLVTGDFSNDYPQLIEYTPPFDSSHRQLLEEMMINRQLEKRFAEPIKSDVQDSLTESQSLFGEDVITVKLEDYIELSSLYEVFYEIVPYVRIKKKKGDYTISVRDPKQNIYYDQPMILVDYISVFDVNEIMKISHTKVEKIEIVNGIYMFGDHALWGVVSLETNTKNFGGIRYPEGSLFVEYQTVNPSQFFDSNHYRTEESRNSRKPDFRNTLYWNPNVILKENKTSIGFYASDHTSAYDIIVKGIDENNNPVFGIKTINITK